MFIKFLFSSFVRGKLQTTLIAGIWVTFTVVTGLTIYATHYLPRGPIYPTGEIICKNDGRGPCAEEYKEDMMNLTIPGWAKFLKRSEGNLLVLSLLFAGLVVSYKDKRDDL